MFLRKIESALLSNVALQGVEGIRKVFIREATKLTVDADRGYSTSEKENILDTEGINLMAVLCHNMVPPQFQYAVLLSGWLVHLH